MTELNTQAQIIELTDDLIKNISGGLDVMDPEPGEILLDDSWYYKRQVARS